MRIKGILLTFLSRFIMVTRKFGVGSFGAGSTSCKTSRVFTKRQVNKVKVMDIYIYGKFVVHYMCSCSKKSFQVFISYAGDNVLS